jgi:hypothetical protein
MRIDSAGAGGLRTIHGANFKLFSGDDASALVFILQGGDGCISVTSNLAPALCRRMYLACMRGQLPEARRLAGRVAPLTAVLFRESNPTPLKYALSLRHLMSSAVRLPLVGPERADQARDRDGGGGFWRRSVRLDRRRNRERLAARRHALRSHVCSNARGVTGSFFRRQVAFASV